MVPGRGATRAALAHAAQDTPGVFFLAPFLLRVAEVGPAEHGVERQALQQAGPQDDEGGGEQDQPALGVGLPVRPGDRALGPLLALPHARRTRIRRWP